MGPTLVGRSEELALLTAGMRGASTGTGSVVHLVGEAGIGKTSLLAYAIALGTESGSTVRAAAADESDRRRPLALVRALFPELDPSRDPDPIGRAIAALERLAADGAVALVADDVHWADDASLDTLRAFARRAAPLGIALLTAARPHPSTLASRRYDEVVAQFGCLVSIGPLLDVDLVELVEQRRGARPGPELTKLLEQTAGNAFLAVEMLDGLADSDRLAVTGSVVELVASGEVPERVVERLARRTLLAVPDGNLLLRAAAVLPAGFTVEELADLLERPLADTVGALLAALDAAVFVDIGSNLAFRHELLRRAVLEATPPSITRTLRRRAAEVLTERGADAERIATCLLSGFEPDDARDVTRLLDVGTLMRERNPSAAADLLAAALSGIAPDDPRSADTALALGWALADAGRLREVPALLAERFARAPRPLPTAVHRLRGHALSLSGHADEAVGQFADEQPAKLIASLDPDDPEALDAAAELALLEVLNARFQEAEPVFEWIAAAPVRPSAAGVAYEAAARAWIHALHGELELGLDAARDGVAAVTRDPTGAAVRARPTLALAILLDAMGESDAARDVLQTRELGPPSPSWNRPLLQFALVVNLFRRGEWDDALAEAEAGLLGAEETDLGLGVGWPYAIGTSICCARGELATAHHWIDRSSGFVESRIIGTEWLLYATALVHEAEGDQETAARILEVVAGTVIDLGVPGLLINFGTDTVRIALATGRSKIATRIVDAFGDVTSRTASPIMHALSDWSRGLTREDPSLIEHAARELLARSRVPEFARAAHDAAVVAARLGRTGDARRLATEAFSVFEALGADQLHARLRAELRAAGVAMRPRRGAARPTTGWESLTMSERAVTELAGAGLTNSEIAERLYVSRRTVESHLGRVYSKLGLGTRTQLVAEVLRQRA
jgi:DNA-binding CsgD family transcriptional regulator